VSEDPSDELQAAWAEAKAACPPGWSITSSGFNSAHELQWSVVAENEASGDVVYGRGTNSTEALRALAAKLAELDDEAPPPTLTGVEPDTTATDDRDAILGRSRAARDRSAERVGPGADQRAGRDRDEAIMREELGEN
jgi:hypothetical protein